MKFLSTIGYAYFGTNEWSVFAYVITYYDYYMMLCELMQRILQRESGDQSMNDWSLNLVHKYLMTKCVIKRRHVVTWMTCGDLDDREYVIEIMGNM